ncbi:Atxe2 family lasso peptide isopeptidase [Novosphingobium sp. KN65.2]|uniref:Atxe2 family lasso peptide isopeptidase n=1 Tax=Novosphingobium sp. KN65.2 TaxID=1478134 RepID=UPI0005E05A54|nr:Atxe2 family lasso peptide isopeptidase [Novosphingobium sp. KN65.2]CDO35966.1 Acylaminoacyl-peptidase [Novosphingobium sp. KN65.2]
MVANASCLKPATLSLAAAFAAFTATPGAAQAGVRGTRDPCAGVLASPFASPSQRTASARDLVRLRDVGFYTGFARKSPLGVAPDGRRIGYVITRADPETNAWCQALVVQDLDAPEPRVVDTGGTYIPVIRYIRGNRTNTGAPDVIRPAWSPDGKWLAYRKRVDGITQVWRVRADGSESHQVTHSDVDVADTGWSPDGKSLLFTRETGVLEADEAIRQEGHVGYHYDARTTPFSGMEPAVSGPRPLEYLAIDLATGKIRPATESERHILGEPTFEGLPAGSSNVTQSRDGTLIWTTASDPKLLMSPRTIWLKNSGGPAVACTAPACRDMKRDVEALFWDGTAVLFLKREGWADARTVLYRWAPGAAARRLHETEDLLMGCTLTGQHLLCMREGTRQPRRIVSIDTRTGKETVIYDPNPVFQNLKLGRTKRLYWRNRYGLPAFGDLVLPPGYAGEKPLPLIVVQYITRGFLRGGTGDEYPIWLFAAHGFAVLSVQTPPMFHESLPDGTVRTWQEAEAADTKGWRERWSTLTSVLAGIAAAKNEVSIDPARIGITGLSDGATTVQFALVNVPNTFAAAAVSSCCMGPVSMRVTGGPAFYAQLRGAGYPSLAKDDPAFWRALSLAENAGRIRVPLLMQLADHEAPLGLDAYTRLHDHGAPVDLFVFPGEYHTKTQPAHRLAIYERNLAWFDFWLGEHAGPYVPQSDDVRRWRAMREGLATTHTP